MEQNEFEELNDTENSPEQEQPNSHMDPEEDDMVQDPFTALMFGPAIRPSLPFSPQQNLQSSQVSHNYIDLDELMVHIDTLYSSYQELKPLFQKIYPFIEQFLKKK